FNGNDNIDIYYLDRFEDIKKENIANSIGKNQLENIFNSIKSETIEKYHYSLDNLLKSILND
ncbi:hypothetical protein, partial [Sutterella wadsworthensis]|uniref:hypothetical protein n=1 Tax=Sutterella wadsworthensis TaxID=40545 RepID=UPI0032BF3A63